MNTTMTGAQGVVASLLDAGVDLCFTNPGTSEMHMVAALDSNPAMRCVLGLFEGVVTGAADGYYRVSGRPAATLLHLGPGLANGLANLHNAGKARSGIVNIVGDHAQAHLALDAPLTSDVAGIAQPMSPWVRTSTSADGAAADAREAVAQARAWRAGIATLILPADAAWGARAQPWQLQGAVAAGLPQPPSVQAVRDISSVLRMRGPTTLLLLGARALDARVSQWAGRIAAATGCALMSEFYGARLQRGAGRVDLPRVPYAVDAALARLAPYTDIVLVDAREPVSFFAYPGKPGRLAAPGARLHTLSAAGQDPLVALQALADETGASRVPWRAVERVAVDPGELRGALDSASIARVLVADLPEDAIVVDEAISTGRGFDRATQGAAPHDWLTNMGGSIGYGLPVAIGAALAAPGRKVVALEGDGSAMYTPQALWTMAREKLDVTVLVFANRAYQILRGEFAGVQAGPMGPRASGMLSLEQPALDWCALARGMGVEGIAVRDTWQLHEAMCAANAQRGPFLIEVVL